MRDDIEYGRRDILRLLGTSTALGAIAPLAGCSSAAIFNDGGASQDASLLLTSERAQVGLGFHSTFLSHSLRGHPEDSLRVQAVLDRLVDDQQKHRLGALRLLPGREAELDELLLAHDRGYIEKVRALVEKGSYMTLSKWSPYGGPGAFTAAASAAAAAVDAVRAVESGQIRSAFALVRPPGHHAGRERAAGYCFFNNIVVAVRSLRAHKDCRVAIFDFDVHHGDGIQEAFYTDPEVLYISTHQDGWPKTGDLNAVGAGAGRGFNINVPLPFGTGDSGFDDVFKSIVEPALRRFKPHIIIGAAGFDTHWRDYQGGLSLSSTGQALLVQRLKNIAGDICEGRLVLVLEGGYQLEVLSTGVSNAIRILASEPGSQPWIRDIYGMGTEREPNVEELIRKVVMLHGLKRPVK
ncbi:MAG: histone deacetylase [Bdellovibrionaceae bacterium]|nr:histone deacetylase [Pseudobdellovibrionaceae bacterium]